ncbi:thiol reductant ABC exporter subunit CydC [Aeromicrobium camelliae]|uniref:Thiol reductant ABC exporter subunit CydC n=1 Tax=Aeromicrobium camelliae TaxID=1538144 RepID=A0A3N6WK65_9ACTN|nr:thiol reductant ABC exporter subunit CydC [Aeromicrobium camelliae]RQN07849.1 thiol reductant ABC exporter subunit CydC [Aeromicrobium camelliae]
MKGRTRRLSLGIALGVASQLAAIGLLLAAAWLIVRAAQHPPVLYLMVAIVAVRAFGIARAVLRYVERLLTHDVALSDATRTRVAVYQQLDRVAPRGLAGHRRGDVVSRVVTDVDRLQDRLLRLRMPWWTGLAAALVVVGVIGTIDLRSGFVVGAAVTVSAVAIRLAVPRLAARRGGGASAQAQGDLAAEVSHLVLAGPDLVAYGAGEQARAAAHRAVTTLAFAQKRGAGAAGLASALVLAVTGMAVAALAAWSAGLPVVVVGVVLLAPIALAEPLDAWGDAERRRPEVDAAAERLDALAGIPAPVHEPATPRPLPDVWDLSLADLAVGWDTTLVEGIDLDLPQGSAAAITGPSGTGKSTLALTLLKLVEPRSGTIRLGGVPVAELAGDDVRRRIGYLGQDDVVFDTTIRENLRIAAPTASDEELLRALDRAGLGAFVRALPDGLDTTVGERGGRLSGGERQRLCLARLLLADHRIVIVDEPTEHLDRPTADALMDDILALVPHRTVVVITHAPEVLARFGQVVTLGAEAVPAVTAATS